MTVWICNAFLISDVTTTCLRWMSSADDVYRSHCYWYEELNIDVSFFEADDHCASHGGRLAPFVDTWQYAIIENMRPTVTPETFLGVIDIGCEDTWTQLDGTVIDSSFTSTFDLNNNQPNGGTSQNCIVIDMEPHSYFRPDKTQDKSCFSDYKTNAMLCYIDTNEFCFGWTSLGDGIFREHCYWMTTKPRTSNSWNVVDALSRCRTEGGTLAPAIDNVQMDFIKSSLTDIFLSPNVTSTGVWMGAHTIRGKEWNWNNDPNFLSTSLGLTTPEKCMRLKKDTLTAAYVNCRSDYTGVLGAVCYKYVPGILQNTTPMTSSPSSTTTTPSPTTTTTMTTTTTTMTTTTTTTEATTTASGGSGQLNLTALEQMKLDLTVDPKDTSAFKSTLISAPDDRFASKCLGYSGVAIISGIFVTILFLDCKVMIGNSEFRKLPPIITISPLNFKPPDINREQLLQQGGSMRPFSNENKAEEVEACPPPSTEAKISPKNRPLLNVPYKKAKLNAG
ncbi:uncharacterized protein LOC144617612 [Crassostrea virginica]